MRNLIMLLICIVVGVTLTFVLILFFRRLNQLERERWGDKARTGAEQSLRSVLTGFFRRKKK